MRNCENCSWVKIYPNPKRVYPELDFLIYCEQSNITNIDINKKLAKGENLSKITCPHWTDDWVK